MFIKITILITIFITSGYSYNLKELQTQILNNNSNLKSLDHDIKISYQNQLMSSKWQNIVLGLGVNDISLNDITNRSKEPMQNQFIQFSQNIPISGRLDYKTNIEKTKTKISQLLLEDKKIKYNSILIGYLNQYVIVYKQIDILTKIKKNIQKIILYQKQRFKVEKTSQSKLISYYNKELQLKLKIETLKSKLEMIKIKIEKLTYQEISSIEYILDDMIVKDINISSILNNNNMYKILKLNVIKQRYNLKYQRALKTNDLKLNVGYYQREKYDDYVSFSISYPLSIYGTEDIKIKQAMQMLSKSSLFLHEFKNEFKTKLKTILINIKLSYMNYNLINNEIINNYKNIDNLLKSRSTYTLNRISQLNNLNDMLNKKIQALKQMDKFYKFKSLLEYYKGKTL